MSDHSRSGPPRAIRQFLRKFFRGPGLATGRGRHRTTRIPAHRQASTRDHGRTPAADIAADLPGAASSEAPVTGGLTSEAADSDGVLSRQEADRPRHIGWAPPDTDLQTQPAADCNASVAATRAPASQRPVAEKEPEAADVIRAPDSAAPPPDTALAVDRPSSPLLPPDIALARRYPASAEQSPAAPDTPGGQVAELPVGQSPRAGAETMRSRDPGDAAQESSRRQVRSNSPKTPLTAAPESARTNSTGESAVPEWGIRSQPASEDPVPPVSVSSTDRPSQQAARDEDPRQERSAETQAPDTDGWARAGSGVISAAESAEAAVAQHGSAATSEPISSAGESPPLRSRASALERPLPRLTPRFSLPGPYLLWNRILLEHLLLGSSDRGGLAYLNITPRILSAVLEAETGELLSAEDATLDFIAAVSDAYRTSILGEPEKLWALAGQGADSMPVSVAFLSLSVLAAYQMHSDEEAGPNAYYPRLAALLGCNLARGHPTGFDPVDFGNLWESLSSWLERRSGRALALPGPDPGLRRYIAYPLCHVPLRQVDIEKLPDFFDSAGLEPGSRADSAFLGEAFQRWASARHLISRAGEDAISDERRPAVENQLAQELEAWDGSWTDGLGGRTAAVHVLLDFRRRQPQLFFLPRRPPAFPSTFDDGSRLFEAGEQGWYDPVAITADDGPALENGFVWISPSLQGQVSLHRPPSRAIALRPSADFTGYISQRGLPLGIECAVLCTASTERTVGEYLSTVTSSGCHALSHPAVPRGWRLFPGIVPTRIDPPPHGLDSLAIESAVTVILKGGLRVGRRATWLSGAAPTVLVSGVQDLPATIDGVPATVTNGVLDATDRLGVGPHVVEVGRVRRRLEIVDPAVRRDLSTPLVGAAGGLGLQPVALPPGPWTVIGPQPDQVARIPTSDRGTLVALSFQPVWAIALGARRGSSCLCLTGRPPSARTTQFGRARPDISAPARTWASVIYDAQVRRPRLGWLYEAGPGEDLWKAWRGYWLASRALRRRWRRRA
jgi:hypothetical protein